MTDNGDCLPLNMNAMQTISVGSVLKRSQVTLVIQKLLKTFFQCFRMVGYQFEMRGSLGKCNVKKVYKYDKNNN